MLDLDEKRTATLNLLHLPSHITSLDLDEKRTAMLYEAHSSQVTLSLDLDEKRTATEDISCPYAKSPG